MSSDADTPMLSGNGDHDCPKCHGRGVVPMEIDGWPGGGAQNCDCVFKRDLLANVKRVWKVLLSVDSVESSPLLKCTQQNVWITASNHTLRQHLRYVAFRMGVPWNARVVADATLISAWLATATEVRDPDVNNPTFEAKEFDKPATAMTLLDLVAPYDLLVIRLGIKAAANKEMANVLAEALNERDMLGKPTWVVDDPGRPLTHGHKCYSEDVLSILEDYTRIVLSSEGNPHTQSGYPTRSLPVGVAPIMKAPGAPVGAYGIKAVSLQGVQAPVPSPSPQRAPAPLSDDEDEFSPASLANAAVMPQPTPTTGFGGGDDDGEEEDLPVGFDLGDLASNYPTAEELRSEGTPSWLARRSLTKEDRQKIEARAKQDKRRKKGGGR